MKALSFFIQFFLIPIILPQTVFSQQHFEREVGIIKADSAMITSNTDSLLSFFNDFVKINSKIDARFDKVKIMKGEGYYYLLAFSKNKQVKSAYELVLVQNTFYEAMTSEGGSHIVTCSGCEVGCTPKKTSDGKWFCSSECEPDPCIKSETIVIHDK